MEELAGKELRKFLLTASQNEIVNYWKKITAPKYGYERLVDCRTLETIATRRD